MNYESSHDRLASAISEMLRGERKVSPDGIPAFSTVDTSEAGKAQRSVSIPHT